MYLYILDQGQRPLSLGHLKKINSWLPRHHIRILFLKSQLQYGFCFHIYFVLNDIVVLYNQTAETSIFSEICLLVEFSRQKDYFAGEIEMIYRWTTKTYIFKFSITTTFKNLPEQQQYIHMYTTTSPNFMYIQIFAYKSNIA